jgi:hypothetical protein
MDPTLLQTREPAAAVPHGEHAHTANNESEVDRLAVEAAADVEYRDLEIEAPKPAVRLRMQPPLEFDGKHYGELIFDFDAMVGKDFQRAEREFNRLYKADKNEMVLPEMKHLYHCIIAAHRANVPLGVILKLPRRYYTPLRVEVLKACGSSPEEEQA